jgi:hypothetical protein
MSISTTSLCLSLSDGVSWTTVFTSAPISPPMLIAGFVDDILIASDNDDALIHVKNLFSRKF